MKNLTRNAFAFLALTLSFSSLTLAGQSDGGQIMQPEIYSCHTDALGSTFFQIHVQAVVYGTYGQPGYREVDTANVQVSRTGAESSQYTLAQDQFTVQHSSPTDSTFVDLQNHLVLQCVSPLNGGMSVSN